MIVAAASKKNIRTHSTDGTPAVADIISSLIGGQNSRRTWSNFKKRTPEIQLHIKTEKRQGGPVDFISAKGFCILVAELRSNTVKGHAALSKLRTEAMEIATQYWSADPTLVTDLIDRIDDPVQLEKIAVRAQTKLTQRLLTDAIKDAGGVNSIYAQVNNVNDIAVTGYSAKDIVAMRAPTGQKRPTRDLLELDELIDLQFIEKEERRAIKKLKPDAGNTEILKAQASVIQGYKAFKQ